MRLFEEIGDPFAGVMGATRGLNAVQRANTPMELTPYEYWRLLYKVASGLSACGQKWRSQYDREGFQLHTKDEMLWFAISVNEMVGKDFRERIVPITSQAIKAGLVMNNEYEVDIMHEGREDYIIGQIGMPGSILSILPQW